MIKWEISAIQLLWRLSLQALINLYNQTAAGPKNISLNLIAELIRLSSERCNFYIIVPDMNEYSKLQSSSYVHFIKIQKVNSLLKKVVLGIYLHLMLIPKLVKKYQITSILAFGNFLLSPVNIKKVVLLHHPYLFDNRLYNELPLFIKMVEAIKRLAFWLTLKNVDCVVVQSSYVLNEFNGIWGSHANKLKVIPNPISNKFVKQSLLEINNIINQRACALNEELTFLYVSRFYPHKNHDFLLSLSEEIRNADIKHKIFVTLDPTIQGVDVFLKKIELKKMPIVNLGEVSQLDLDRFYKTSHFLLFPSKSETFGNPLIEAMSCGLPIIVPALQYAKAVVGETGIYYRENDAKDCATKILSLIKNRSKYIAKSLSTHDRFDFYPNVETWTKLYLSVLES